jgi:isopentenyl diphosphate isomerase/L-lactate dehydrogenase-like FMN-dependent dehydrogenase
MVDKVVDLIADAGTRDAAPTPVAKADAGNRASSRSVDDERLELVPPKAGTGNLAMADQPGSGATGAAVSNALKAELARAKEALATREQESGELKSRVRELEDISSKNDRLISLKDSEPTRDKLTWRHVELMRRLWKGKLVLKGILDPEDARIARESGIDGVIVSNHGGRQLDGAVAPLRALPGVKAEAGSMTVMMDSGIRRGTDVLKALALGAQFVFVGRPFLYAAVVAGNRSQQRADAG